MNKLLRNIAIISISAPMLFSCAMQSDVNDLRYQLRIVNKKLEDMKANTVGQLQKNQAATVGQMDSLENEILELKSQLEDSSHLNQRLREQNKELEVAISSVAQEEATKREAMIEKLESLQREKEAQLAELNDKLTQQQKSVKAIQEARVLEAERKAKEATLAAELAKSKAQTSKTGGSAPQQHFGAEKRKVMLSVSAPETAPAVKKNNTVSPPASDSPAKAAAQPTKPVAQPAVATLTQEEEQLKDAKRLFANKDFKTALPIFSQIADSKVSNVDTIEARYFMGECLVELREYDKAIMQFQRIISQNPNHERAPASLLQQGVTFEKLSDKDTAKVIYKKLLKQHPSSPEAAKAKVNLDKL